MFAVKDKRTGKYLKAFNGSFNHASFYVQCAIAEKMLGGRKKGIDNSLAVVNKTREVGWEEIVKEMFCLKTPHGGQIYKSEGAVAASIGKQDWLEIVPVKITVARKKKEK